MDYKINIFFETAEDLNSNGSNTLTQLYRLLKEQNQLLRNGKQEIFSDSFEQESFNLIPFGFEENIIGSIYIEKMNIKLPIYLGATKENLLKGATHMVNTSFPLGENDSNVVIAAHRGLITNQMFRHIDKLEKGDEVIVTTLWDELKYKVCECEVISPFDFEKLKIQKNRDMVTLITCHPFRINYQRYVVYCEREQ